MERVATLSSEKPVLIFAASNDCQTSQMLMILFSDIGARASVHELDKDPCGRDVERELASVCAAPIPVVFIGGKLIGSTNEIMSLHLSGSLVPLLRGVGAMSI